MEQQEHALFAGMEKKEYEPRKLFVGGLPRSGFTKDRVRSHFARYGHVVDALAMEFPDGMGRGFGFVEFQDEEAALRALDVTQRKEHDNFFGRKVDVKRAEKKQGLRSAPTQSTTYNRSAPTQGTRYNRNADSKKIFVGGLGDKITKDDLSDYFEKFGTITDAVVMYDKETKKARGFGFVTFDSQEASYKVLENSFHFLKGTKVETKNVEPRYQNGRYHGSVTWGAMGYSSPANCYGGMYSPHNLPFVAYNGPYFVPYPYVPPGIINYGYMMNQAGTSNGTSMMTMQPPPGMYAHYGRSYGYNAASLKLESDGKVKGNHQRIDISSPAGMKSDPVNPDYNSDISAPAGMKSDPVNPDSNSL